MLMYEKELNEAIRSLRPSDALRARVLNAAVDAAVERSMRCSAFERRIGVMEPSCPDNFNEGEYNPDYYKNMVTRFTLCDPDDTAQLQSMMISALK